MELHYDITKQDFIDFNLNYYNNNAKMCIRDRARTAHGQSDRRRGFALAAAAVQVNESCHAFPSIIR